MGGLRYDDLRATPEYIAREKARKRLANRAQWVRKNWPRIEAEVKGDADKHCETYQSLRDEDVPQVP